MSRLLLVGGEGYVGRGLLDDLSSKYEVDVTTRKDRSNKLFLDLGDIGSIEAVLSSGYDTILFLASKVSITDDKTVDLDGELFGSNVKGLNNFLDVLIRSCHGAKFIYASSMSVYSMDASSPVTEEAKTSPSHPYGLSKLMAEKLVSYYAENFGVNSLILRLAGVFGGDRYGGYVANTVSKLLANEPVTIDAKGLGFWESMYLSDLSQIVSELLAAYDFKSSCEVVNIGYGEECDFVATAFALKELCDSGSDIVVSCAEYRRFFMDNEKLKSYVDMSRYSYKKALKHYVDDRCAL